MQPARSISLEGMTRTAIARRGCEDGMEEALALLRLDLLRVVQAGERPDAVPAQRAVVEQDAGDDERPGERPSPASSAPATNRASEAPVEAEQPLSGRERHRRG